MTAKYLSHPDAFEHLKNMIIADTGQKECFSVGFDHIGDYWKYKEEWQHRGDFKKTLPLSGVLKVARLSENRYEEYKRLFTLTDSKVITFCHIPNKPQIVSILIYSSGLSISGCAGLIQWNNQNFLLASIGKRGKGEFTEITPLSNGWYLNFDCT
jgi:hypothetical protein